MGDVKFLESAGTTDASFVDRIINRFVSRQYVTKAVIADLNTIAKTQLKSTLYITIRKVDWYALTFMLLLFRFRQLDRT